jgi:hypothetical protein
VSKGSRVHINTRFLEFLQYHQKLLLNAFNRRFKLFYEFVQVSREVLLNVAVFLSVVVQIIKHVLDRSKSTQACNKSLHSTLNVVLWVKKPCWNFFTAGS